MKLTKVKYSINNSISNSIYYKCLSKTFDSTSFNVLSKIRNEILTPNRDSIGDMQIIILDNLKDEIN